MKHLQSCSMWAEGCQCSDQLELLSALKRLVIYATEFQKSATLLDDTDTTTDHNLTVALQLAKEAIATAEGR